MIIMFPGQGSQRVGMGVELFAKYPDEMRVADLLLGYSLADLCTNGPTKDLNDTANTQPAIFVVNALSFMEFRKNSSEVVSYFLGHSLGEYNALLAAGAFDFETGLKIVIERARLMAGVSDGGMAALLGCSATETLDFLAMNGLTVEIANENSGKQTVISGSNEQLLNVQNALKNNTKIAFFKLPTSGAFHSSFMMTPRFSFEDFLRDFSFAKLNTPVISNFSAKPYDSENIVDMLSAQLTNPVKWLDSIRYLLGLGESDFKEIGHGQILSKIVNQIITEESALKK